MDNIRIAVCIAGQPRTWERCVESWKSLFSRFENAQVDYFYHMWDFNSLPQILNDFTPQPVGREDFERLHAHLLPKKHVIENHAKSMKVIEDIRQAGERYNISGGTPVHWSGSQFYSSMRASHLKREYEIEQGFQYDLCFKLRTDLYFGEFAIDQMIAEFEYPRANTIYSCHNGPADVFPFYRIGDIYYYSDSNTFDKLGEFYRWLPVIGISPFGHDNSPPEIPFAFYINMMMINNVSKTADPKVMRTDEYAVKKNEQGKGLLGGHELT
jgi:hypothetical protein